ncbi:leucine-rich repeat-containing protein [Tanacetum coccineum]
MTIIPHMSFPNDNESRDSRRIFPTTSNKFMDLTVNWKNSFQGLPIGNLVIYTLLDLSDNNIYGEIPASFGNLKGLKVLNISHNMISGHIPVSFGNLGSMESLDLSHNEISGSIPQSLAKLVQLEVLDVSNNRLRGKIPRGGQMDTMNELNYFQNNSGLCGMQIKITCPEDIPPSEGRHEEDEQQSRIFWEGTWVGFPVGFFSAILIMGYSLNFLQLFKFW